MTSIPISDGRGSLIRHIIESEFIPSRAVDVWLPPNIAEGERLPVLYMQDGQNVFDPALSFTGIDWGADEAVSSLSKQAGIAGAIVVAIWNAGENRRREYAPRQALLELGNPDIWRDFVARSGEPQSDEYLKFLVEEVKPAIDSAYPTLPDATHTFIMGSSLGALISLYALEQYPNVFGGAACLSTHWPLGGEALVDAMARHLPEPGRHRLYFDFGTETLDSAYEPLQSRMDALLEARGYQDGIDWLTKKFPGADHSEAAWRARLIWPLRFLLLGSPQL